MVEESTTDTGSDVFGFRMPNNKARDGQLQENGPIQRRGDEEDEEDEDEDEDEEEEEDG
ncbi:hypothetical protein M441DRAFT_26216 [Trichoderma asperellum CBS 433.97]|uniref:Uncharacterized protein n=1 Tax=Trichoderma asperellum (strain ATCC 204424 / CBS 433.97 / NBRC 101777) TaxID=1042311 RepID=A0A2T3ZCE7_TRIA4|nr:hypothetical protein M441DRAFT_26216 [Trichoderma asperellum CBS 433.97]PTB42474.1 hypothetical protein M441DRAFT_26216 [Trichoderma asperellum CBS 433.97]